MSLHNYKEKLTLKDTFYRKQVRNYFAWQLEGDLGNTKQDVTSEAVFGSKKVKSIAQINAKESGVLAGAEEIIWFLKQNKIEVKSFKKDGTAFRKGERIFLLKGDIKTMLKLERTALNLIQRMSGIATLTSKMKKKVSMKTALCPTRKTYLGLLDKKAVSVGGGGTHRLGLYDAVLVKENHLKGQKLSEVVFNIAALQKKIEFAEIEVESISQLKTVLSEIKKYKHRKIQWVVMLDNFSLLNIRKALLLTRKFSVKVELSGNITFENVKKYGNLGADIISSGSLTHSVKALDFSMKVLG